jgi:septal ring factor EnvC (AmiA/AmiB activator)
LIVLLALPAFPRNESELSAIKARITRQERELGALAGQRDTAVRQLEIIRQKIDAERQAVILLDNQISANNKRINTLQTEEAALKRKITIHEAQGRRGIIFMLDNMGAPTLRMVFTGTDPAVISATAELLERVTNTLSAKIRTYMELALSAATLRQQIANENRQLAAARSEREIMRQQYNNSHKELSATLAVIRQDEKARQDYLDMLKREEERINMALRESAKRRAFNPNTPFARERGRLPRPIVGRVIKPFGERLIPEAGVRIMHNGLRIAPTGNGEVMSIADGQVVYVAHINGMRNIIIVQHDSEYYTVYANLDEFYVTLSENLEKNAVIGRIDIDFKDDSSYLYFEIRRHENALNPALWLSR